MISLRGVVRLLLAFPIALLLAACGGDAGPAITEADKKLGAEQHPQLLAEFGGAYNAEEAQYVSALGAKLSSSAGLGGRCTFTLVNTDVVNAFAVPGCYIYVTRGLLAIVNSEAELASVLAHELGHIAGNHSHRQQQRSVLRQLGVIAVSILSDSAGLTQLASQAAGLFDLRYSRSHEYEADDLGIGYMRKAGYDPFAAAAMLGALQRQNAFQASARGGTEAKRIPEWTLTHPLTENRIARARQTAEKTGLKPDALPEGEAQYLREVDGLLYGDDPTQGFILGRRFAHPVMRVVFEAPPGFALTNNPRAVLIDGPNARGEFAGTRVPPGGLQAYADALLKATVGNTPVQVVNVRPGQVNGVEALLVQARVAGRQGQADLWLAVYRGGEQTAYHFLMLSRSGADSAGIDALFRSFRMLTPAEAAALRPRYVRVVTAAPGDTQRSLAARMAADRPMETLALLNGFKPDAPVRPGEKVKLLAFQER